MLHTALSVLLFDVILVPPFVIIITAGNIFWIRDISARFGNPFSFILGASFIVTSIFCLWIIIAAQDGIV